MGKKIGWFIAGLFFGVGVFGMPMSVSAQVSFGGYIGVVVQPPCETPPGLLLYTTTGPLMYLFGGSVSFIAGPPRGSGQGLLGMFGGYIPCIQWRPEPITIGGGPYIIFHGSS